MEVMYERHCGLDVHKKSINPCVLTGDYQQIRTFGTT